MVKPTKVEFEVGKTVYGQQLRLVLERTTTGVMCWTLYKDALNQRDESQAIHGIDGQTLRNMAEATSQFR